MLFQRLSTSNTFSQWVAETQKIIPFVNEITGGYGTLYSNTNVSVGEDLHVNGNVIVTGTFILDEIGYDDLTVAGNLVVDKTITALSGEFLNLNVVSNVVTVNTTTDVVVGKDALLYEELDANILHAKNLTVNGEFVISNTNLTASNVTINLLQIDNGELNVSENTILGNTTITYGNMEVANLYNFVGPANTQIYDTIESSNAVVFATEQRGIFIGLAVALG